MGRMAISCIITLVLQINFAAAAVSGCPLNPYSKHPSCTRTCSKTPRIHHSSNFTCNIGFQTEWHDFWRSHGLKSASYIRNSSRCIPPLMTGISLNPLPYDNGRYFSPSLNISFKASFLGNTEELKAIKLTFQSPKFTSEADERFTDKAYSIGENPGIIDRVFNFSSYIPNTYDKENPIIIDYPCLYGLDECPEERKIYMITLTSITMSMGNRYKDYYKCNPVSPCGMCSLNYTISVSPARYIIWNTDSDKALNPEFEKWNMTIATTLYPNPTDIYVLLEPPKYFVKLYSIELLKNGKMVNEKRTSTTTHTFKAVQPGKYKIKVIVYRTQSSTFEHRSEYITHHTVVIYGSDIHSGQQHKELALGIVSVVSGIVAGVLLIAIIAFFKLNWNKMRTSEKGFTKEPEYFILSHGDRPSEMFSENLKTSLGKLRLHVQHTRNSEILQKELDKNSYILILLPLEHDSFSFKISGESEYEQVIESLSRKMSRIRNHNVFLVYFPYFEGVKKVHWEVLRKYKKICLIRDYCKMIKLLNVRKIDKAIVHNERSNLIIALRDLEDFLRYYNEFPTSSKKERIYNNVENIICPVHGRPYVENRENNIIPDAIGEHSPFLPPSPMISKSKRNNSVFTSGYNTEISLPFGKNIAKTGENQSDSNESLTLDSNSIIEAMKDINFVTHQSERGGIMRDEEERDPMIAINFY